MSNLPPGCTDADIDRAIEDAEPPPVDFGYPADYEDYDSLRGEYPAEAELDALLDALIARIDEVEAMRRGYEQQWPAEECPF